MHVKATGLAHETIVSGTHLLKREGGREMQPEYGHITEEFPIILGYIWP